MDGMDEEKQSNVESQLSTGMSKSASDEDIQGVLSKKSIIMKLIIENLASYMEEARLLWNMLVDYKKGRYTNVPWKLIAAIVFFFLYLVNPLDVIPDSIPVLGFLDDGYVLKLVLDVFAGEINSYKEWLVGHPTSDMLLTYKDVLEELLNNKPDDSAIKKGAAMKKQLPNKQIEVTILYLDANNEPVWGKDKNNVYGCSIITKQLDKELQSMFDNKDVIIFE